MDCQEAVDRLTKPRRRLCNIAQKNRGETGAGNRNISLQRV